MKYTLLLGASALAMGLGGWAVPAYAGNIVLTGHDNDAHCFNSASDPACPVLSTELSYVRNGSTLPVLAIANPNPEYVPSGGGLLTTALGRVSVPYTVEAVDSVTAGMFNHSTYSAFVVASDSACGGCDNPPGTGTKLATFSSAIASFLNSGGGILGLAGATDPDAYAYLPDSAGVPTPIYASSGFHATSTGTAGIPGFAAVNGDQTHNTFSNPGTNGVSPAYKVAERYGGTTAADPAVTLFASATVKCSGSKCTISSTTPVPEPATLALLGAGLFGLGVVRRRRRHA